ncbi:MAG: hypothetical protein JXD23_03595 [Spirochaetales bacterium]|nr:hypothetical protein [Spirochaetales bacterium]
MEKLRPALADTIKHRMFVFADRKVIAKLAAELDAEIMVALSSCPAPVKDHVLSALAPEKREKLIREWRELDTSLERIDAAQGKAVGEIRRWAGNGSIEVKGPDGPDPETGVPGLKLAKRE